jgi:hypothetical protein
MSVLGRFLGFVLGGFVFELIRLAKEKREKNKDANKPVSKV